MKRAVVVILMLLAGSAGCIGSVNPIVDDRNAIFEPSLLGTWADSAKRERAVITQDGPRSYAITYTNDEGQAVSLIGRLGRSNARYIFDVQPTSAALGAYDGYVVRLHLPIILDATTGRVGVRVLEPDSITTFLRTHPKVVAHGRTKDGLLLTADSPQLQRFLATYLKRPGVLADPSMWTRQTP